MVLGKSHFVHQHFPLSFQLSDSIDEGCEINSHFKMQVNDTKYLYTLAIVVAKFGMAGVGKCCGGVGAGEKTQVQSHFLDFFFLI